MRKGKKVHIARTAHKLKEEKFGETSELLQRERDLDISDIHQMIELFWDVHYLREQSTDVGVIPLNPTKIKDHLELSGRKLSKWEYRTLMEMDLAYRATVIDNYK